MISRKILIIVFLILLAQTVSADQECDFCDSDLAGNYYRSSDGKAICSSCYTKYPGCYTCGKISKSTIDADGHEFCSDCYIKLRRCELCSDAITGAYNFYPDLQINICAECERSKPRCQNCNRPVKNLIRVKDKGLCENCMTHSERCHSCGGAILKDYAFFEGDQTKKYCNECVSSYTKCSDCGAPSGPRASKLDDGRFLCPDCRSIALFNPKLITPLKNFAIDYLDQVMGMNVNHDINYTLQDSDFLKKISKGKDKDLNGMFHRKGNDFNIYVLYGLRKYDMIGVLVHEITHAWQTENCNDKMKLLDREGFAQWTSYHALINQGYKQTAESLLLGDSVYSNGLKKMLNIERKNGRKAVIDFILSL